MTGRVFRRYVPTVMPVVPGARGLARPLAPGRGGVLSRANRRGRAVSQAFARHASAHHGAPHRGLVMHRRAGAVGPAQHPRPAEQAVTHGRQCAGHIPPVAGPAHSYVMPANQRCDLWS
jgi:hypothetical protein